MSANLKQAFEGKRFLIAPGHFDFFGGAERQSVLLAQELVQQYGCHVDFLGWGGDGILADEVRQIGCQPWVFPLDPGQRGIGFLKNLHRLSRFIRNQIQPDYLLPFVGAHCKILGSIWKRTGAKFCWWNQRDEGRLIYGTKREHQLLHTLPAVVSNSFEGRDFLVDKFKLSSDRVKVINNGIVIPTAKPDLDYRKANGIADDHVVLAMIANLSEYKDHTTLLKAFRILRSSEIGERCQLVLAGRDAGMTQQLKALAFDLQLCDSVSFPGSLTPLKVQSLLAATDIVVHSSVKEGCPNGALEAMAVGKCVLGTDISGMRQALGENIGNKCLAPPNDADGLAELMIKAAHASQRLAAIGLENQKRIAEHFSVSRMTRQVLEVVLQEQL